MALQILPQRTPLIDPAGQTMNWNWWRLLEAMVAGINSAAGVLTLASGKIFVGNGSNVATAQTMSGDGTLNAAGALAVTKTGGVAFAASATTNALNASNISSGTLPLAQLPALALTNLTDYSIGSWTPADNSGAGLAFTSVSANYTKLGNMILAYFTLTYPATIDATAASISGLPFTVANQNYAQVPAVAMNTATLSMVLQAVKNTLTAALKLGTTGAAVTNAQLSGATVTAILAYPVA